jgi:hypothetical protein
MVDLSNTASLTRTAIPLDRTSDTLDPTPMGGGSALFKFTDPLQEKEK